MENRNVSSGGLGFTGALTIAFIILKLLGKINWSWVWVLSPIWISILLVILVIIITVIVALIQKKRRGF